MSDLDDAINELQSDQQSSPQATQNVASASPLEQAIHEVHADAGAPSPVAEPSLWDKYRGFQESQLAGATGGIASLAGGLSYLGGLALTGDPDKAEDVRKRTTAALTYEPRTAEGKKQAAAMADASSYLGEKGGNIAGDYVADKTGSPLLGAAANTAMNVPQFLVGAKGAKDLGEGALPPGAKPTVAPAVTPEPSVTDSVLKKGQELGYVVPPTTTNPSAFNRTVEGLAGKQSTAQLASIKNQPVTDNLARQELGLDKDAELTPETMQAIREKQSPAYEAVKKVPAIELGPKYQKDLSALTSTADKITAEVPGYKATGSEKIQDLISSLKAPKQLSGDTAVELSKSLRAEASSYEASAKRTLDPSDKAMARAYRGSATALENAIQDHLQKTGQGDLATNWDNARRTIAKTYSVQDALDGAGHVDASKLAKQSIKGKPLSGNLEAIADFANAFPKATKVGASKESMPGLSPFDYMSGAGIGLGVGIHEQAILPAAAGAILPVSRMAGRSALLSKAGQKLATPSAPNPGSIVAPVGQSVTAGQRRLDELMRTGQ